MTRQFRNTSPTPHNCTFLENMWWQEPDESAESHRRTTALFSYSIFPRCSGSFGHPRMTKGWRITPCSKCTFSCRVVFLVAFSILKKCSLSLSPLSPSTPSGEHGSSPHYHKLSGSISLRGQRMWSALAGAPHSYYSSSALSANSVLNEWMNHQATNK